MYAGLDLLACKKKLRKEVVVQESPGSSSGLVPLLDLWSRSLLVLVHVSVPWPCRSMSTPPGQCRAPTHGIAATAHLRLSWRQPLPGACSGTSPLRWPSTPVWGWDGAPMQPGGSAVPQLPLCCGPVAELRLRCTAIGLYLLLRRAGRRSLMRPTYRPRVEVASGGRGPMPAAAMASRTAITAAYRKPLAARAIRGRGEPPDARRDREFGGPAREKKYTQL